jgi:hypothetical protein
LAGDSSLDNKYWIPSTGQRNSIPIPAIYKAALDGNLIKPDVAFWLNSLFGNDATALNLAVEESMLRERDHELLEHDKFIRDNIREQDVLIVSVGANDIALKPSISTMINMLRLAWLTPNSSLQSGRAWAYPHFVHMFEKQVQAYISRMIEVKKPRLVVVCMIYFPLQSDKGSQASWADLPLKALGYDGHPERLQTAIQQMYEKATKQIQIKGTEVVTCPFFQVLDGKTEGDYSQRVEPSTEGGKKMAVQLKGIIDEVFKEE